MTNQTLDFTNPNVITEIERRAYAEGAPALAEVLGALHDALQQIEHLETIIADTETLAQWERKNGSADSYKEFFYGCFERLDGHYPYPSVTSDYDKKVIFQTIERKEEARDNA